MIQRYSEIDQPNAMYDWGMKKDNEGSFVKYTDHLAEIEAVKNRVCDIVKDWADEIRLPSGYNDDLEKLYKKIKSEVER